MSYPILSTRISHATLVTLRDRTRQVGEVFGLGKLENTRFVTAISEIARNAVQYAGEGSIAFSFRETKSKQVPQALIAVVSDAGPGIPDIEDILAGRPNAKGQVPLGLAGARRLVDALSIESPETGGTIVTIEMLLSRTEPLTRVELGKRVEDLARQKQKTALEEMEEQNRDMLDALQELRGKQMELKRAEERKNQFLATLAHELRNPLSTLHMNLEIMRRKLDLSPEELGKRCGAMARQTEQMTRLIEDMMDVSRVSQGKVELNSVPLEVNELVSQTLEMMGSAITGKQHQAILHPCGEEMWIEGDGTRLKQVFGNLIQNAARYTPPNGTITISIWRDERHACIEIADNGVGISAEMLPQIFDLFVQGDSAMPYSPGGLGIGLTLVLRLVEGHGGKVIATSAGVGRGSEFLVCLPLKD